MPLSRLKVLPVLALCVLLQSCLWQRTMTFPSPSHRARIEIWQTRLDNHWGTQVRLVSPQRRAVVFENRTEAWVYFVHVYWSSEEARVGVMASGGNIWRLAFDVDSGKEVPFDSIRDEFARSIRQTYRVPPDQDPIQWAAMSEAQGAFFRLHPEIHLSYQ
jgi:hypothetical protein